MTDLTEEVVCVEDWQLAVGDWLWGTATDYPIEGSITGLDDLPGVRQVVVDRGGMHGSYVAPLYSGSRYVTAGFYLIANGDPVPVMARFVARNTPIIDLATGLPALPYPIQFKFPGRDPEFVMGRAIQRSIPQTLDYSLGMGHGVLQVLCEDPAIYTVGSKTLRMEYPAGAGGTVLPAVLPMTLAPSGAATASAENDGDWITPVVAEIRGNCTGIQFGNLTTGAILEWTGTLADGDVLSFDSLLSTVDLNGTPAGEFLTAESAWPILVPGTNTLLLIAGSGDAAADVSWHDAHL